MNNAFTKPTPEAQAKIQEIFILADRLELCEGDVQIIARREFKTYLHDMGMDMLDSLRVWIKNNWYRSTQIINPEMHQQLMQSNDTRYSTWFNARELEHNSTTRERNQ